MTRNWRKALRLKAAVGVCAVAALCTAGVALAGVKGQAAATKVTVTFTDTKLAISKLSLQAGRTTFLVVNKGKHRHVLAISGPGLKSASTPKVAPGGTAKLTVTLKAGAYMLADPIGLGEYNVRFLDIVPAAVVSAKGDSSVVDTSTIPAGMCGTGYVPAP